MYATFEACVPLCLGRRLQHRRGMGPSAVAGQDCACWRWPQHPTRRLQSIQRILYLRMQVLMPGMVAVSLAVPLAIWLRRDAFLARREPLLAAKHLAEAVIIAHVMPRKIWLSPRDYLTFLVQWCSPFLNSAPPAALCSAHPCASFLCSPSLLLLKLACHSLFDLAATENHTGGNQMEKF